MRNIVIFFAILFLLILQSGFSFLSASGFANLVLLFLVASTIVEEFKKSLSLALIGGVMLDLTSVTADGIFTLSLLFTFLSLYFLVIFLFPKDFRHLIPASAVVATLLFFNFSVLIGNFFGLHFFLFKKLWLDLLLNLVFVYPVFWFYQWVTRLSSKYAQSI